MTPITVKMLSLLILGFDDDKSPSEVEVNAAYKRMSLVFHPDMPTGNKEQFRALSSAKEYLVANMPKAAPVYATPAPNPSYNPPQPDFAQRQREQRERWAEQERRERERQEQYQKERQEKQKRQFTDIPW